MHLLGVKPLLAQMRRRDLGTYFLSYYAWRICAEAGIRRRFCKPHGHSARKTTRHREANTKLDRRVNAGRPVFINAAGVTLMISTVSCDICAAQARCCTQDNCGRRSVRTSPFVDRRENGLSQSCAIAAAVSCIVAFLTGGAGFRVQTRPARRITIRVPDVVAALRLDWLHDCITQAQ